VMACIRSSFGLFCCCGPSTDPRLWREAAFIHSVRIWGGKYFKSFLAWVSGQDLPEESERARHHVRNVQRLDLPPVRQDYDQVTQNLEAIQLGQPKAGAVAASGL